MDEIDIVARDHRVTSTEIRAAVLVGIQRAWQKYGRVHIGLVRPYLPPWATGPQVGATITTLVRNGVLVPTGGFALSNNRRTRNRLRPVKVYRLTADVADIPKEKERR